MSENRFKPVLGLWDGTMIVVGSMIGSGVFIVGANILQNVGSAGLADCCLANHRLYDDHRGGKLW